MPPLRGLRDRARAAATPYTDGWLSRRHRRSRTRRADGDGHLPADVLSVIFARASSSAADVARISSTCRHWGLVGATHAAAICRSLPPPTGYHTHLTLGFFHQENEDVRAFRRRRRPRDSPQPSFVPTASASRLIGPLRSLLLGDLFDHARPVASRNGRLVLELQRQERAQGLTLSVCNPMTGEVSVLPALYSKDCPGYYTCAILTGDDLDATTPLGFFRLLLVYNRPSFTALRTFSSDVGRWGPEGRKPGAKIDAGKLRRLGPAVVVGGVAYWPMHRAALGVRLDGAPMEAIMDVGFVPYVQHYFPDYRLMGVTPDGSLSFIFALFNGFGIDVHSPKLQSLSAVGEFDWELRERIYLPEVPESRSTALKMRWFNEKSGTVLFTTREGGDATSGAFMLNLATKSVEKLADGVQCHGWRNFCGYEMDRAALLASVVRL